MRSDDVSENWSRLTTRLETRPNPDVYEEYLLEAVRLSESGHARSRALAIVQAVMILDWFANELIEGRLLPSLETQLESSKLKAIVRQRLWEWDSDGERVGTARVSTRDKFERYFPALGVSLPDGLRNQLVQMIRKRNEIAHRTQGHPMSEQEARKTVSVAMEVVRYCMDALIQREAGA